MTVVETDRIDMADESDESDELTPDRMFRLLEEMSVPEGVKAEIVGGNIFMSPRRDTHGEIIRRVARPWTTRTAKQWPRPASPVRTTVAESPHAAVASCSFGTNSMCGRPPLRSNLRRTPTTRVRIRPITAAATKETAPPAANPTRAP